MAEEKSIKCFLKFGKRKNISGISKGSIWLSTPECLRPLEKSLVKGQGDKIEGGMHIHATSMRLTDLDSQKNFEVSKKEIDLDVLLEPVNTVPVYCLFACYEKDIDISGNIKLSKDIQSTIIKHFPEADSVAIIKEPYKFIEEFVNSIHNIEEIDKVIPCKYGFIQYFYMYGIETLQDGVKRIVNDGEFLNFLMKNRDPQKFGNMKVYPVYVDDAWRHLFCKDKFFEDEQEFRFVLPSESVKNGKLYAIGVNQNIQINDLNEFFESMN